MKSLDWMDRAACIGMDTELFFPDPGGNPNPALAVCRRCPVTVECLEFGQKLARRWGGQAGVFGGMTANQRRGVPAPKPTHGTCSECGGTYSISPAVGSPPKTCSPGCKRARQRQAEAKYRAQRRRSA